MKQLAQAQREVEVCLRLRAPADGARLEGKPDRKEARLLFFSSRGRHTRFDCDWSSDVCSSDLLGRPPLPTESSFGSSSWIFTPSITASRVSVPWSSRSNAFCTARNPLALATATGFAAQRLCGGGGPGGRPRHGGVLGPHAAAPPAGGAVGGGHPHTPPT